MFFQPLVYFTAVVWAVGFVLFGLYLAFRRASVPLTDRVVGLLASLLVGSLGAAILIGGFYLVEELI
jgi:putative copper export protein